MKRKGKTRESQKNKETSRNQSRQQKSHQKNKHLYISPWELFWTIRKMDKGGTQTNRIKDKKIDDNIQDLTVG